MKEYKYILFDLDGTLTDPGMGITNSVMHALAKWNIHVDDRRELYKFIGPPLLDSFADFYGFSPEECQLALKYYREYFADKGLYENEVYDGTERMLEAIKNAGKTIVLCTSKPQEYAVRILEHFGLDKYFDFFAGASMDEKRSAKSDVIEYALETCGCANRAEAIMIGDREHDIFGAKKCGLASMGVLYGYGDRAELETAGADYIAASPDEVAQLLTNQ